MILGVAILVDILEEEGKEGVGGGGGVERGREKTREEGGDKGQEKLAYHSM